MCSVSDIPVVGKAVDKISEVIVDAGTRGVGYLFCYKGLVNDLKTTKLKELEIQEESIARKAAAEKNNGKVILKHVIDWQDDVVEAKDRVNVFLEKYEQRPFWICCFKALRIPNPISRFQLGRNGAKLTKRVTKLTGSAKELICDEIAQHPPYENVPISAGDPYHNFESRQSAYGNIWEALVNKDGVSVLGIYGMPGVGKTRMVEKIWEEAKEKGIFDKVARANVGKEKLDVKNIQEQLAFCIGCHLESKDNEEHRAFQVKNSLMNGGKTLVILDDVWRHIPLVRIGIPFSVSRSDGCKILFTSRMLDACLNNNCKNPVWIETLTDDEAWEMFSSVVGTFKINSLQDKSLAKRVCNKCAGLPLLIVAVGKSVAIMLEFQWKDALDHLENHKIEKIPGIEGDLYACVELSFDALYKDEKIFLLLSSLFREDADIDIHLLFKFATDSELLEGGRNRVDSIVYNLKSSSLLLQGRSDKYIKLHDIIRDVARSIAARPEYAFLSIRCNSWLPDHNDYRTRKLIYLDLEEDNVCFPDDLVCPDLHTLWLQSNRHRQQLSDGFFNMFPNLRFLVIRNLNFFQQHLSNESLGKLRTLILDHCNLDESSLSIVTKNLRTLRFWGCSLPAGPLVLPDLKNLRRLDVFSHQKIEMMANAVSSLHNLEELSIPAGIREHIYAELSKLTRLRVLKISFEHSQSCPDESFMLNLVDFYITVSSSKPSFLPVTSLSGSDSSTRYVQFCCDSIEGGGKILAERAETLILENVGSTNPFIDYNRGAFKDLRNLRMKNCHHFNYLARMPEVDIQQIQQRKAFSSLTELNISNCQSLKFLFCASVVKCLMQLQTLHVCSCPAMEVIIRSDCPPYKKFIAFLQLKSMVLSNMPKLASFYGNQRNMGSSSTNSTDISSVHSPSLFDEMVAIPSLEKLEITGLKIASKIWGGNDYADNSFCQLKSLVVSGCDELEIIIPLAMLHRLKNLERLYVAFCNKLRNVMLPCIARDLVHLKDMCVILCLTIEEIIEAPESSRQEMDDEIVFPALMVLLLSNLPSLNNFWGYEYTEPKNGQYRAHKVTFPNLVKYQISGQKFSWKEIEFSPDDSASETECLLSSDIDYRPSCYEPTTIANYRRLVLE